MGSLTSKCICCLCLSEEKSVKFSTYAVLTYTLLVLLISSFARDYYVIIYNVFLLAFLVKLLIDLNKEKSSFKNYSGIILMFFTLICVYGIINIIYTLGMFSSLKKEIGVELLLVIMGYGKNNNEELDSEEKKEIVKIYKILSILFLVGYIIYAILMGNYFYTTYKYIKNLKEQKEYNRKLEAGNQ
ncbi:hypothetical protein LY90DRAFT_669091 [Neocallimastix californiae]|uniref:Uncharacterized protein n=1 Tax=Neocallimastix californiae TaxID=1754190 RepID=A0A1Y2DFD0_9FUNG|nr:hypothetical protein LY90DRAFT_669091 [Neocallimastix californiae]|eukprot:ORY57971.1 hypothetical protein LY90DRAFT_669091 [Neocallimastix californiae]